METRTETPSITADIKKRRHKDAQARYQAKRALDPAPADPVEPGVAELRREKHRQAQARYRQKNKDQTQLMRWAKTKKGAEFSLSMLASVSHGESEP